MIRYLLMAFLLAGALVIEEMVGSIPYVGAISPNLGLLFVMGYAMKGSEEDFWILCFLSGLVKAGLAPGPAGAYILVYLALCWIVLRVRGLLFMEHALAQVTLVFLGGCLLHGWQVVASTLGYFPEIGGEMLLRTLLSSTFAAGLAPLAVKVLERSRLIRGLVRP